MADPQRDAPIGEVARALFPVAGTAVIPKVAKVALGQSVGNGGVLSWQNPEAVGILAAVIIDITTVQSAQTADVGVDGDGTGSSDTLLDGVSLATAGALSSFADAGTNGAALRKVDAKEIEMMGSVSRLATPCQGERLGLSTVSFKYFDERFLLRRLYVARF